MITGELKNKINSLWEIFWTGGITSPLDVVEQMTYLMFIHDRARESAMLNLPYESMFRAEVQSRARTEQSFLVPKGEIQKELEGMV